MEEVEKADFFKRLEELVEPRKEFRTYTLVPKSIDSILSYAPKMNHSILKLSSKYQKFSHQIFKSTSLFFELFSFFSLKGLDQMNSPSPKSCFQRSPKSSISFCTTWKGQTFHFGNSWNGTRRQSIAKIFILNSIKMMPVGPLQ